MDNKTKVIFILRIILLILLVIFFFVFNSTSKSDCQACSFKIEEKELDTDEFFQLYYDECLITNEGYLNIPGEMIVEMIKP